MEQEFDSVKKEVAGKEENNREGYRKPAYSASSDGTVHRQRVRVQRPAYGSDRPRFNNREEGGFRPDGFASALANDGTESNERRQSYQARPRYNSNNNGYGQRQQSYRPRYNNGGEESGQERSYSQQGGYNNRGGYNQQGGYNNNRGGYGSNNNRGSYNQQGGYGQRQHGYRPRYNNGGEENGQERGYGQQGGYNNRGYNNNRGGYGQQGGYNNNRGGYGQKGGYNKPGNNRGGYGQRQRTADYDPNAKYSMKKRIEYKEANIDPNAPIRLNKYLANAGVCSRREADDFIQAGLVTVNGEVITELGTKVLRSDKVVFHDQPISIEKKVYVLLNKPKDTVTSTDDPQQRKTVMELVKDACPERIYPVGRLDRNTTGVLLLTNDGELASKLTHPRFLKKKVYHVFTDKNVTAADIKQIAEGIELEDGPIRADAIEYASPTDKKQVGIEIHSGKNRIVRRIFEHLGYKVIKLDRVQFAGLTKKNVRRGDWRFLTEKEVDMLRMGAFE